VFKGLSAECSTLSRGISFNSIDAGAHVSLDAAVNRDG